MQAIRYADYRQAVRAHLLAYRRRHFAGRDALFQPDTRGEIAFRPEAAHRNFFDPALYHELTRRPRAFLGLASSRVLAISVFGTLARREDLALLAEVPCDDGRPLVASAHEAQALAFDPERPAPSLYQRATGERELWLAGTTQHLAVYSRFLERDLGPCLQPERGHCSGDYVRREGRANCWHSEHGACYWQHLTGVLGWDGQREHRPCPLCRPYGLVRTLLALAADPAARGMECSLVVVYDGRNPAFAPGRQALRLLAAVEASLMVPIALRRTTWQAIAGAIARSPWHSDLVGYLREKYGIEP